MKRKMSLGSLIVNRSLLMIPCKRYVIFSLGLTSLLSLAMPLKAIAWDCELVEGVWQRSISAGHCGYKYENVNVIANSGNVTIQPTSVGQCIPSGHCSCLDDSNKPSNGPVTSSRYGHPGAQLSCEQFTKNLIISSDHLKINSADGTETWIRTSTSTSTSASASRNSRSNQSASTPYSNGTPYGGSNPTGESQEEDSATSGNKFNTDNGKNMSDCINLTESSGQYVIQNSCDTAITVTYCAEGHFAKSSNNFAMQCGKGLHSNVIDAKDYGKGMTTVQPSGQSVIAATPGAHIKMFACEYPHNPYLVSYNPPRGVCGN